MSTSKIWQSESLSKVYLEGVRGATPLSEEQVDVMLHIIRLWRPEVRRFLDLGCGDGILGRAILSQHPEAHGSFMDFSNHMLHEARAKVGTRSKAEFVLADFAAPAWKRDVGVDFDVIVSGYAIHHQTDERKAAIYREIYDLLAPGGVFLNVEHVASATPNVEAIYNEMFVDALFAFHESIGSNKTRDEVAQEFYYRPDKDANILAPVHEQCEWLRQVGFEDVDCFFRIFELAVFGGRKATAG